MRLIKARLFRDAKRPWILLFLAILIAVYVWMAVSPLRNATSYSKFMEDYGDMDPRKVSFAVLGEERPDLSLDAIYKEFMARQGGWLYVRSFVNSASGMAWISCLMAAFFLCRDLGEDSVRPMLLSGYRRSSVFIWLVVRYYVLGIVITAVALAFVRSAWSLKLSSFPSKYVVGTQLRYLLYSLSTFSYPLLIAFLLKNPILSTVATFIEVLLLNWISKLFPAFSPVSVVAKEAHWEEAVAPGAYVNFVIAAFVIIAVCVTASWFIFRRRDA